MPLQHGVVRITQNVYLTCFNLYHIIVFTKLISLFYSEKKKRSKVTKLLGKHNPNTSLFRLY